MEASTEFYIHKLKEDLSLKQRNNPHYSLRAYAKYLGIHSSTLSQVLNGKRGLPVKSGKFIADKLNLSIKDRSSFLESLYQSRTKLDEIKINYNEEQLILDESYSKVIAEWEHYAVLTLFDVDSFRPTIDEVSKRLGITKIRTEVVFLNLKNCGLIEVNQSGEFEKTFHKVKTTEDVQSQALRASHLEALEMGKIMLDEIAIDLRDFSSVTVAMDLNRIPEMKAIIREFRQKVEALAEGGKKTDVCQLAIQFYPLTKNLNKTSEAYI